jgi:hypothetical protein
MVFAGLGLSLAAAIVLHYSLEQPFIRFGRYLSKEATNSQSALLITAVDSYSQK